jgi:signal transduction histidine kinase
VASSLGDSDQTTSVRTTSVRFVSPVLQAILRRVRFSGYSLAVISVLLAFLLRLLADPWLGDQSPYLLFVVAVAVTGLYEGVRPALLAATMGTVAAYFCFVPPRYQWGFAGVSDAVGFGVYVLGVASVILLTHARIRAAKKAEQHRVRAEEILLKAERLSAAGQMASLLAHEINNPLAALTNVMFLLNQQPLNSTSQELLTAATNALHRINRIASMTLGFFFEKDKAAPVRICEIVDEVAESVMAVGRFKHIDLRRDFECNPILIASRPRIRQLIASLITNAMESEANAVRVRVRTAMDWRRPGRTGIRITIADDGRGIRSDIRQDIFEPFFSTKLEKATGLGLWASRAIAVRNDGTIRLRSAVRDPRKGTCVSVFLPTSPETALPLELKRAAGTAK